MASGHSPLAQFEVKTLIPLPPFFGYDISFTNASLFMTLAMGAVMLFVGLGMRRGALVPSRFQSMVELSYEFVTGVIKDSAGKEGLKYFPFVFSLFMFLLFANLLGMMPYSFTVTSHIVVTFALAAIVFLGVTIIGFARHGLHFFSLFLPAGTPLWMAPLMILIELVSYLARPISLSVRLAANMLAGHLLLKLMAGFIAVGLIGIFPFAFIVVLTAFEIFVACLQAYIFTLLTCIYLNDAIHLH